MPGNTKKKRRKGRGTQGGGPSTRPAARPRNRAEARQRAQQRRSQAKRGARGRSAKASQVGSGREPQPASWRSALTKGGLASILFFALFAGLFKRPIAASAALAGFTLVFYVPVSYWLDGFMYNRYQRNLARDQEKDKQDQGTNGTG